MNLINTKDPSVLEQTPPKIEKMTQNLSVKRKSLPNSSGIISKSTANINIDSKDQHTSSSKSKYSRNQSIGKIYTPESGDLEINKNSNFNMGQNEN
jgi:hypothetical protein